jgi:hypothetical protein
LQSITAICLAPFHIPQCLDEVIRKLKAILALGADQEVFLKSGHFGFWKPLQSVLIELLI